MTIDELKSVFHVDHHDLVPEYELVRIDHPNKISSLKSKNITQNLIDVDEKIKSNDTNDIMKQLHLKAFGRPISLSLLPTSGLYKKGKLKIWTVEPNATAQHGVEYVELPERIWQRKKVTAFSKLTQDNAKSENVYSVLKY
ncbi:hypothetical protein WA026_018288 [Henosepilachna vigintioctopunctata]|uniref:Uncharacterized protein n=1 Tax=Henosepilachna vigintioctopunctata TaxID=420089 RepID=A0AAW1VGA6_9CUCU